MAVADTLAYYDTATIKATYNFYSSDVEVVKLFHLSLMVQQSKLASLFLAKNVKLWHYYFVSD
jgi:hypothetical protein